MEVPSGEQFDWRACSHHFDSRHQAGRSPQFTATPNMDPSVARLPATPQGPTHSNTSFIPRGVAGNGENFGSTKWLPAWDEAIERWNWDEAIERWMDAQAPLGPCDRIPIWDEAMERWVPRVFASDQSTDQLNAGEPRLPAHVWSDPNAHNPQDPYPHCPHTGRRITKWTSQTPAAAVLPTTTLGTATPVVMPTSSAVSGNGEKFNSSSVPPNPDSSSPSDRWQSVLEFREKLSSRFPSSHGSPVSSTSGARTPTCHWPSASPDGERSRDSSLQPPNTARPGTPLSHCNSPALPHVVSPTPSSADSSATPVMGNRTTIAAPVPGRMVLLAYWLGGISAVPDNGTIGAAPGPSRGTNAIPVSGLGFSAAAPLPNRCSGGAPVPNEVTDAPAGPVNDAPTGGAALTPVQHKATSAAATPAPVSNRAGGNPRLKLRRLELEFRLTRHSSGLSMQWSPPSPTKGIAGTPVPAVTPVAAATSAVSATSVTVARPAPISNGASGDSRLTGCLHSQSIQRPMPSPAVLASALPSGNSTHGELRSGNQPTDQLNAGEPRLPAHAWSNLSDHGRALWDGLAQADKLILLSAKGAATLPDASPASSNNNTSRIATGQFQGTTHSFPAIPSETGESPPNDPSPPLASLSPQRSKKQRQSLSAVTLPLCVTPSGPF